MKRALPALVAALSAASLSFGVPAFGAEATASDAPPAHARWANSSALTIRPHRMEGALLGRWAWAIGDRVELRSHPVFSLLVPALEVKVQLWNNDRFYLSSRHQLSTPTPFLRLVAKEGALGLLPANTEIPLTFLAENALLATLRVTGEQWFTLFAGGVLAVPGAAPGPLLEFPFLYQRYAALHSGATLFSGIAVNGSLGSWFGYNLESQLWALPLPQPNLQIAWESSLGISWFASEAQRVELNVRAAVADFPMGVRLHWFPGIDYGWAW